VATAHQADDSFELDYDQDVGETCRVRVDPWSGEIIPEGVDTPLPRSDPERTSRVQVDPWTGEVLEIEVDAESDEDSGQGERLYQPLVSQAVSGSTVSSMAARSRQFNVRSVLWIAFVAAIAGAFFGGVMTLLLLFVL